MSEKKGPEIKEKSKYNFDEVSVPNENLLKTRSSFERSMDEIELAEARTKLRRAGISDRVAERIEDEKAVEEFYEGQKRISRSENRHASKTRKLQSKLIRVGLSVAVAVVSIMGLKSLADRISLRNEKEIPKRERVVKATPEVSPETQQVEANLQANLEAGTELDGLDYVSEMPADQNGVNKAIVENLEVQKEAEKKGVEVNDGLKTENLE